MEKNSTKLEKSAATQTPRAGDGTQPAATPERKANWFGSSDRPQEEFIEDQPNRPDDSRNNPEGEGPRRSSDT